MKTCEFLGFFTALIGFGGVYAATVNGDAAWIGQLGLGAMAVTVGVWLAQLTSKRRRA